MPQTVLYYTPEQYAECAVGNRVYHLGHTILIHGRWMREDLGNYFEIVYTYLS